jgi:hypothetical protein
VALTLFSDSTRAFSLQKAPIAFRTTTRTVTQLPTPLYSSFAADGSEYSSKDKADNDDDDEGAGGFGGGGFRDDNDETPTVELQPIPTSKNSGNRFVAFVWDRVLDNIKDSDSDRDGLDLHYDRMKYTEDHVMFCRKTNLYNETFNTDSMVDILWSLPMYVLCCVALELNWVDWKI